MMTMTLPALKIGKKIYCSVPKEVLKRKKARIANLSAETYHRIGGVLAADTSKCAISEGEQPTIEVEEGDLFLMYEFGAKDSDKHKIPVELVLYEEEKDFAKSMYDYTNMVQKKEKVRNLLFDEVLATRELYRKEYAQSRSMLLLEHLWSSVDSPLFKAFSLSMSDGEKLSWSYAADSIKKYLFSGDEAPFIRRFNAKIQKTFLTTAFDSATKHLRNAKAIKTPIGFDAILVMLKHILLENIDAVYVDELNVLIDKKMSDIKNVNLTDGEAMSRYRGLTGRRILEDEIANLV